MRLRVRQRLRGHFRLVQALFSQRLSQSFQRFFDHNLPVGLSKSQLHRRSRRRIAWRRDRSEEHTSELQSQSNLVCRLLLEKKKKKQMRTMQRSVNRATTLSY